MSEEQRIELTKHELASLYSVGIWFETILMQMLVRHIYDRPTGSAHARYGWTEIADECRHSVMFSRAAEKFGGPEYRPGWLVHQLGRLFKTTSNGTLTFAGTIYVEEILDALQREQMADESLQPIVQKVSWIHVVEEARHIRYARDETLRQWPRLGRLGRAYSRLILAVVVYCSTVSLIDPKVYAAVGWTSRRPSQRLPRTRTGARPSSSPHAGSSSSSTRWDSSPAPESCSGVAPECCDGCAHQSDSLSGGRA